ncbi:hypothetical protein BGZ57DRAFT_871438 [Hyaloscypha finlandica]|nr:hypothetical protein BGZ57DRAFT_871438 [Hyaloscypha finlandica]
MANSLFFAGLTFNLFWVPTRQETELKLINQTSALFRIKKLLKLCTCNSLFPPGSGLCCKMKWLRNYCYTKA